MHNKSIKRGGRSKRIEKRLAKPIIDPCPPGQKGGSYKPLSQDDIKKIYNTAIDLLVNLGVGDVPKRLFKDLISIGAKDNGSGRVLFPKNLVEEAISNAAKSFVLQ